MTTIAADTFHTPSAHADAQLDSAALPPPEPLRRTIRRHRLLLVALFCGLCSAIFLLTPLLPRTYALTASLPVKLQPFDPIPQLTTLPDTLLKKLDADARAQNVDLRLTPTSPNTLTLHLAATANTRDRAWVRLHTLSDQFAHLLRHDAQHHIDDYRLSLEKSATRLTDQEASLTRDIQSFRDTHRGVLPEDPTSVVNQLDKLSTRLDEKQQRLHLVTDQISRLEEYKRNSLNKSATPPPPLPPPISAETPAAPAPAPVKPENDPEVLTLTAQLQLVSDQLDQQLNALRRTEQHPYVVDLRTQQVTLQKKLDAAKQRAAAGQPPPPQSRAPLTGAAPAADPTLAAAQQVDLQIESLRAEKNTLDVELRTLTGQRDLLQKQADQVMPARREYEQLTSQLDAVKKELTALKTRREEFNTRFTPPPSPVDLPDENPAAAPTLPGLDIAPLALASTSSLPTFPNLPLVFASGPLLGSLAAGLAALLLRRTNHRIHTIKQAERLIDLPILGTISQIRTPGQRRRQQLWKSAGRPVAIAALFLVTGATALLCYRHLADPNFPQTPSLSALLSPGALHLVIKEPTP